MGTSAQNFIDLLFGGVNKGLDVARQQQGQQVDLALTIQQMLARQKEQDRAFKFQESQAREARNWNFGLNLQNQMQQAADNAFRKQQWGASEGRANAESLRRTAADLKANAEEVAQIKFWTDLAAKNPAMAPIADMMLGGAPAGAVSAMMQKQGGGDTPKNPYMDRVDWYFKQIYGQKDEDGAPYSVERAKMLAHQQAAKDMGMVPESDEVTPEQMAAELKAAGIDATADHPRLREAYLKLKGQK